MGVDDAQSYPGTGMREGNQNAEMQRRHVTHAVGEYQGRKDGKVLRLPAQAQHTGDPLARVELELLAAGEVPLAAADLRPYFFQFRRFPADLDAREEIGLGPRHLEKAGGLHLERAEDLAVGMEGDRGAPAVRGWPRRSPRPGSCSGTAPPTRTPWPWWGRASGSGPLAQAGPTGWRTPRRPSG